MITFKPTGAELESLKQAAVSLQEANAALARAKKSADAAKKTIADWLEKERKTDVDKLPIGETLSIEGACLILVDKQNKFDEKDFLSKNPNLHAEFKKDFRVIRYKPAAA